MQCKRTSSLFGWLVADGWCWFVLREEYCWLIARGWFVLREKYCWLVADKPNEQGPPLQQRRRRWSWASLSSHELMVNSRVQEKLFTPPTTSSCFPFAPGPEFTAPRVLTPLTSHTTHICMLTSAEASSDTILQHPIWTCCTHHHIHTCMC
jgi:hypothetical protein